MLLLAILLKFNMLQQTINPGVHANPYNIDPQDQNHRTHKMLMVQGVLFFILGWFYG